MLVKKNYQVTRGIAIDFMSNNHSFYGEHPFDVLDDRFQSTATVVYADYMYETKSINPPAIRLESRISAMHFMKALNIYI